MTRIVARGDDGTEQDVTETINGTLMWLMAFERESPCNFDELRRRIILWPLLGYSASQWQEMLDYELRRVEEQKMNHLRRQFDAETAAARDVEFQQWAKERGQG